MTPNFVPVCKGKGRSPQNFASKASAPRFTTLDKAHVRTHASAKIDFVNIAPQILGLIR
ncbi:MAG: hypothetical protein QNJ57_10775 [Flavobacteriaceae bacterium]|nr:hypothetical protein [Flavobacteriaceae bacterium]